MEAVGGREIVGGRVQAAGTARQYIYAAIADPPTPACQGSLAVRTLTPGPKGVYPIMYPPPGLPKPRFQPDGARYYLLCGVPKNIRQLATWPHTPLQR